MSARALRKVLQQQEPELKLELVKYHNTDFPADNESESSSDSARAFTNRFDLLNELEVEHDQENELSKVKKEDNVSKNIATNFSKKYPKKKKKKGKDDGVDSLNILLKDLFFEVDLSCGVDLSRGVDQSSRNISVIVNNAKKKSPTHILQLDLNFLSADSELRRIFGSEVIDSSEESNLAEISGQSHLKRRVIHHKKKMMIISPSKHWHRWDKSLSMELVENKGGCNYFRYVHSPAYKLVQIQFEAANATNDPKKVENILLHHPYHIDSLITVAEYYNYKRDHQKSADATAKALYALECAWNPLFTPLNVNCELKTKDCTLVKCQLKYKHETNRPLFTTLFAHMEHMDRLGCHRSALEICKFLICLDSDDPMGALFCIDCLSIRAEEYKWLERFAKEYDSGISLQLYPNFSFSLAICRFYLEREEHMKQTKTKVVASDLMKQALMLHPSVVRKLVIKVPWSERVWSTIVNHSFFNKKELRNASLDPLINIYVEKSYIIWRLPELHNFLKQTALSIIENMENH